MSRAIPRGAFRGALLEELKRVAFSGIREPSGGDDALRLGKEALRVHDQR